MKPSTAEHWVKIVVSKALKKDRHIDNVEDSGGVPVLKASPTFDVDIGGNIVRITIATLKGADLKQLGR